MKPTYKELEEQITALKKQNDILNQLVNSEKINDSKYRKMIGNIEDVIVINSPVCLVLPNPHQLDFVSPPELWHSLL